MLKIIAENKMVTRETISKHSRLNKSILHVCGPTLPYLSLYSCWHQFTFLCKISVSYTDLNIFQPTFQAVPGKAGLKFQNNYIGNQNKHIMLHIEEHRVNFYIIGMWRQGIYGKTEHRVYLLLSGVAIERVNWNIGHHIFESNYMIILCQYGKDFGIPQHM